MTAKIPKTKKRLAALAKRGEGPAPEALREITPQVTTHVTPQVAAVLRAVAQAPISRGELPRVVGMRNCEHLRKAHLEGMSARGWWNLLRATRRGAACRSTARPRRAIEC